jgi:hypothetical protein
MGQMRFLVTPAERITEEMLRQAHLTGLDRVSWQTRAVGKGGQLVVHRAVSDSANLQVPWPVEGRGLLTLKTGSLMEGPAAYHLPLELARGTVAQLREQSAEWQLIGVSVPERIVAQIKEATELLGRAAVGQHDRAASAGLAEEAIRVALEAGDLLAAAYAEQATAARRRAATRTPACLGGDLGDRPPGEAIAGPFLEAFNTANVPLAWHQIESSEGVCEWDAADRQIAWCEDRKLRVCAGPLLKFHDAALPDWLFLYEGDFESIVAFASEHIRRAVGRYHGRVALWQCAGRINAAEVLGLSDEERLQLAARAIELVRSLDPQAAILVTFDQPWAEYLSHREMDFPPLYFADALVRAGLDLSGLVLEVNLGFSPGATLPRTVLEFARHLDYWALLGLPLVLSVSVPGGSGPAGAAPAHDGTPHDDWTPRAQQTWVARYLPPILAKPYVLGVLWNQLSDAQAHEFPGGGLFDHRGQPKPALKTLAAIRERFLA